MNIIKQLKTAAALLALLGITACGGGGGGGDAGVCAAGKVLQNGQCVAPIAAPSGVDAVAGDGQATVSWPAVAGASSYNLYKAAASGVTTGNYASLSAGSKATGATSPFVQSGLTNGATYYFVVTALDANGESLESSEVAATPLAPVAAAGKLNDTGIYRGDACFKDLYSFPVSCSSAEAIALNDAQDGMVGRDAVTATNSDADGKLGFSFSAIAGGCVLDNVTGLMWEVKTTDGGLRDWNKKYTNYGDGSANDASTYVVAVNAVNLCGYADWRLPTVDELQGIVDYGVAFPGPAIDATWFPNANNLWSWTGSSVVGHSDYAWFVSFNNGYVDNFHRSFLNAVRLVRAGQPSTTPRYIISADGHEVTDSQTNLVWRRCVEGMNWNGTTCVGAATTFNNAAAFQRVSAQVAGTGKVWRLPNAKELVSIVDKRRSNPSIDQTSFPATPAGFYWSSSPVAKPPLAGNDDMVWYVDFDFGAVSRQARIETLYVRLVRAGQ